MIFMIFQGKRNLTKTFENLAYFDRYSYICISNIKENLVVFATFANIYYYHYGVKQNSSKALEKFSIRHYIGQRLSYNA